MVKFAHTADIHIGKNRRFCNYLDRSRDVIDEIHKKCIKHKVDFLIIAGDILDTTYPTQEEKELVAHLLGRSPIPVLLTSGNHEYIGPNWENTALRWLLNMTPRLKGVKFVTEPTSLHWMGVWWVVIPYSSFNTASFYLVAKSLLDKIPKDTRDTIIAVSHEFFDGVIINAPYKNKATLPVFKRVDYWALGDIHQGQQIGKNSWYCGSPLQQNFGEKLPKGMLIVDINKNVNVDFVELTSAKQLKTIKGVPKKFPKDAYIKLVCKAKDLPNPLPENVVALSTMTKKDLQQQGEEIHNLIGTKPLIEDVTEYLRNVGFRAKRLKRAIKFCKEVLKTQE